MSVWASSQGRTANTDGGVVVVNEYYTTINTDASGLVNIDISSLNVSEVLSVTINPVINGVTTVANSLIVAIQEITTTGIRALIGRPNPTTVTVGATISPIVAVGSGVPCRCRVAYRKA